MKAPTRDVPGHEPPQRDAADMKTIAGQRRDLFEDPNWSAPGRERPHDAPGRFALPARTARGPAAGPVLIPKGDNNGS